MLDIIDRKPITLLGCNLISEHHHSVFIRELVEKRNRFVILSEALKPRLSSASRFPCITYDFALFKSNLFIDRHGFTDDLVTNMIDYMYMNTIEKPDRIKKKISYNFKKITFKKNNL